MYGGRRLSEQALHVDTLILGAGPTGLGAASTLHQKGVSWMLVEKESTPGGLARSWKDEAGFIWDFAIHVMHPQDQETRSMIQKLMGENLQTVQRKSWVYVRKTFVAYPFQYHYGQLPEALKKMCEEGLLDLLGSDRNGGRTTDHPDGELRGTLDFQTWILETFGKGIADLFMIPYNEKVWGTSLSEMSCDWIESRVAPVTREQIQKGFDASCKEVEWGPNAAFMYPVEGGVGAFWKAVSLSLPQDCVSYRTECIAIDEEAQVAYLSDGRTVSYQQIISSIPLPILCRLLMCDDFQHLAGALKARSVQVMGLGFQGGLPPAFKDRSWIYFPESYFPFYRCTSFSELSKDLVPEGDYSSLLFEFAHSQGESSRDAEALLEKILTVLETSGLYPEARKRLCAHHEMVALYGYPVPTKTRDDVLEELLPKLESLKIYSGGRFGGWKYEESNMDHCYQAGRSLAIKAMT